jgi:hypothetical protein
MTAIQYLDVPPPGWFVLDVCRAQSGRHWAALMVDVHPDELKHCRCKMAALYIHPDEYRPGNRVAREAWVKIPGKHRDKDAAWRALETAMATRQ